MASPTIARVWRGRTRHDRDLDLLIEQPKSVQVPRICHSQGTAGGEE